MKVEETGREVGRRADGNSQAAAGPEDFEVFEDGKLKLTNTSSQEFEFVSVPSVGSKGPKRLLVSLILSTTVCQLATAGGPSLFPGDSIAVRLSGAVNTAKNRTGDRFQGVVDHNVEVNGLVAIPKGAVVQGVLKNVVSSGRLRRRSEVTLEIDTVEIAGKRQVLEVEPQTRLGADHKGHDGKYIGGGALFGLVVGALAGGGKGAAAGTAAGAATGAGGAALTGKAELYIPSETVMIFRLRNRFSPELQ